MRGTEQKQESMLTLLSPERAVPQKHPLRKVKELADAALRELSPVFDEMYSALGRPTGCGPACTRSSLKPSKRRNGPG